jgi:hypothetical protein
MKIAVLDDVWVAQALEELLPLCLRHVRVKHVKYPKDLGSYDLVIVADQTRGRETTLFNQERIRGIRIMFPQLVIIVYCALPFLEKPLLEAGADEFVFKVGGTKDLLDAIEHHLNLNKGESMSLTMDRNTEPEGLTIEIWRKSGTISLEKDFVRLGDYLIGIEDFLVAAYYVLTNSDLYPGDPRRQFVKSIAAMIEVEGWNPGGKRLMTEVEPVKDYFRQK